MASKPPVQSKSRSSSHSIQEEGNIYVWLNCTSHIVRIPRSDHCSHLPHQTVDDPLSRHHTALTKATTGTSTLSSVCQLQHCFRAWSSLEESRGKKRDSFHSRCSEVTQDPPTFKDKIVKPSDGRPSWWNAFNGFTTDSAFSLWRRGRPDASPRQRWWEQQHQQPPVQCNFRTKKAGSGTGQWRWVE